MKFAIIVNPLLILIIIYLFYILYNKKNCDVPVVDLNPLKTILPKLKKKSSYVIPSDLYELVELAVAELSKSKELRLENPSSSLVLCKKIIESPSDSELLFESLKTILLNSTLTSRYLLEIRIYLVGE